MRYWLYKCSIDGGPAGYWGDWLPDVFRKKGPIQWGGDYSTQSAEVSKYLTEDVAVGDVVVAYQTNDRVVVGFCAVTKLTGKTGARKLYLQPIHRLAQPFRLHDNKVGTVLESSVAVNGPVMLRELNANEMKALVKLSGAPQRVLRGKPAAGGWTPVAVA
ncbi:hypothetical protein [Rhodococcus erythropolis]|uniref:hypothetical protein n=1 Tax=Rhodococcus erythropolis TaxID=1833 RepID=UPI0036DEA412